MAREVVLDPGEALVRDPHPRPVTHDEAASEPPAEQKADRVAGGRADPNDPDGENDRRLSLPRDSPAEDHDGLAGQHEPDERGRLDER
jgi:hypothetical protein